ncbi:CHAT domain-containing protein [Irpex rosettiformis]|uniref:CHAT domain-containing protein n=1 Tax=Irpex rosettiformis TaxID=378272 RepID=A0ACB8UE89_9APHY|nr:CHAT domain-containing protein [Irpex rosettiformis]
MPRDEGTSPRDGDSLSRGASSHKLDVPLDFTHLRVLGENAFKQYLAHGDQSALATSIQSLRYAAALAPDGDPEKPTILTNFGVALDIRFERIGSLPDLEEAITAFTFAVSLTPDQFPVKPSRLNRLGNCLRQRFENAGNPKDVEEAIKHLARAIALTPDNHPDKPGRINNLGTSLQRRFEHSGNIEDLEMAIKLETRALSITPDSHPDKSTQLSNLGVALRARFERAGKLEDLEEAITLWTRSVELTPKRHSDKATRLNNLGTSLHERFERLGNLEDLEKAIKLQTRAVKITQDGSPEKPTFLTNLGNSFRERFAQVGKLEDLEQAITFQTRAVEFIPERHPDKPSLLINLGGSLRERFERVGRLDDLQKAIMLQSGAVELTADSHSDKPIWLDSLGNSLREQFERSGNLEDLEKAIMLQTHGVELIASDHPNKPAYLSSLGNSLRTRYERVGSLDDLDKAIALQASAAERTPDDDPRKLSWLTNLSVSLHRRFEHLRRLEDLEQVIKILASTASLTPDDHPGKPARLSNLGNSVHERFQELGSSEDLEQAVALQTRAVNLTPADHPDKPTRLCNLCKTLLNRFDRVGNASDLEEAVAFGTRSVELLPKDHPDRAMALGALARTYSIRLYSAHAEARDLEHALLASMTAMQETSGFPLIRMRAGLQYIKLLSHPSLTIPPTVSLLQAHEQVLNLIPEIVWLGNNVYRRYEQLVHHGSLANTAAADAIAAGEHVRALEWLENGRTVVWSQMLKLRTPLDNLRKRYPQLASDLQSVSQTLELASAPKGFADLASEVVAPASSPGNAHPQKSLKDQANSSHTHALEYAKLIAHIRSLKGFEDFLRPKTLAQLAPACASGPVVVINMHESRCDALVLYHPGNVAHIPLPDFSYERAQNLRKQLWTVLSHKRLRSQFRDSSYDENQNRGPLPPGRKRKEHDPMSLVLADLWRLVVKPIIDLIKTLPTTSATNELPHITWCPTGPLVFLPLHAAGIYPIDGPSQMIMDHAVSSYTPTLEALLRPRTPVKTGQVPRILVVAQPDTPGCNPIKATEGEATLVQSHFSKTTDILKRSEGTVNAVLEGMGTHDWVHLACHGIQRYDDPTSSSFALHDGKLTLSMLMAKSLPNAQLAVLSACQTATGDERLSEEAVHLAAGMLNVGYKSVIGTMWSIYDSSAPIVTNKFYEAMSKQVSEGGELLPAQALHEATKVLRQQYGEQDFVRWVPFVHFGL